MSNLSLKNINKVYLNNVHAVHDFSLDIQDKEFIVFVGPSGCGKSTTIRMIAGLEDISSGEFYIDGKLMNYVPSKDRDISMVFQNYALYPHMSVYRNMAYSLTIKRDYLPIFEKSEEVSELQKKVMTLKKENLALAKALLKNNDEETKEKYLKNYQDTEDCLSIIYATRKPVIGHDEKRIRRLKKELSKIDEEISYVQDWLKKEEAPSEGEKDLSFIDMLKKDKASLEESKKEKEMLLKTISNSDSVILKRRKLYPYEVDYEVYRAARILDLNLYLYRFPSELSGGQRQRVALGRAIVRRPKVFLMDEPLSNLDAKLRVQTRGEIARIHERVGATTIYVTHDQTEAMTLADRLVIMKDGYVQQIAKPMDAFENPVNMFVAGFIGSPSMNFIPGFVVDGHFVSKDEKGDEVLNVALSDERIECLKSYEGKEVVLGIRPEHLSLAYGEKGDLKGDVQSVELLGSEFILYAKIAKETIAIKTTEPISPSLRGILPFSIDRSKMYFFDKETTLRIKNE